jgi:hypothetical protein
LTIILVICDVACGSEDRFHGLPASIPELFGVGDSATARRSIFEKADVYTGGVLFFTHVNLASTQSSGHPSIVFESDDWVW